VNANHLFLRAASSERVFLVGIASLVVIDAVTTSRFAIAEAISLDPSSTVRSRAFRE
jgi:hypothetical protein